MRCLNTPPNFQKFVIFGQSFDKVSALVETAQLIAQDIVPVEHFELTCPVISEGRNLSINQDFAWTTRWLGQLRFLDR
jgi:hypothetical protein